MKKLLKLQNSKYSPDDGFITLEILVSIFIASAFLAVSMQSLVFAMAMKIQAQEKNKANELITEQLEMTNALANSSSLAGVCDTSNYPDGYGSGLWNELNIDNTDPPTKTLLADGHGKTLALEAEEVSNDPLGIYTNPPHRTLKVRYQVWEWDDHDGDGGNDFLAKDRTVRTLPNPGANIAGDQPIAETYVEIIPDVALACP